MCNDCPENQHWAMIEPLSTARPAQYPTYKAALAFCAHHLDSTHLIYLFIFLEHITQEAYRKP